MNYANIYLRNIKCGKMLLLMPPGKTSRQQVLDYIHSQGAVTSHDLSRALNMTTANARHHLAILSSLGVIEEIGERHIPFKGRPAKVYRLALLLRGHNLDRLTIALLSEVASLSQLPGDIDPLVINRLAKRLSKDSNLAGMLPTAHELSSEVPGEDLDLT